MEKEDQRHLTILNEIAEGQYLTQRAIADKMGVALGLVNLYLKRLVRKGYVKVSTFPSNRIKYLLTPKGVAEKARLTYEFMGHSLNLYRETRRKIRAGLEPLIDRGVRRVAIYGTSEAAELTFLSLRELGLEISAVISEDEDQGAFLGIPVHRLSDISPDSMDLIIMAGFPLEKSDVRALEQHGIPDRKIFSLYP
jgi:DNA-binding MarR family transcriptional regulator